MMRVWIDQRGHLEELKMTNGDETLAWTLRDECMTGTTWEDYGFALKDWPLAIAVLSHPVNLSFIGGGPRIEALTIW